MIERLDHFVLTVADIEATCQFYKQALGMQVVSFQEGRKALTFGSQKINLHALGNEFEPKAGRVQAGSADLCFITKTPIHELQTHLQTQGIQIIEGPVERTGATGKILSIYFRDLDENLIEVANDL